MVNKNFERILIIKWGALGDLVAATPAIKTIRDNYPDAKITLLTNPLMNQLIPPGFLVNEHIIVNTNRNKVEDSILKQILLAFNLKRKKFDLAINLRWTSERAALLTFLSGAKERISSGPKKMMNLYTIQLDHPVGRYHEINRNLDIVRALGLVVNDDNPVIYISDDDKKFAENFYNNSSLNQKSAICIHPGASRAIRAWLPERFSEIGKRIIENFGMNIIVTWGNNESELAEKVVEAIGSGAVKSPETRTIGQLASLIQSSKLFFSNCTGPMNVAVAVRTPVVALLGSSDPVDWGAYGNQHINIKSPLKLEHYSDEDERKAMEAISIEMVWEKISKKIIELNSGSK
jgi:ADP-heptose:LPS heptosyltransferase